MEQYFHILHQRIGSAWFHDMPRAAKDPWFSKAVVTVRFAVLPDGTLDPPRVTASSGRSSYDHHALEAIRQAGPFDPLPDGDDQPLLVCFHFGYHIDAEHLTPKASDPLPYTAPSPANSGPAAPTPPPL